MKKVVSIILLCILSMTLALTFVGCGEKDGGSGNSAHAHPIIQVKGKAATCGANGMEEHYYCEYCMTYFNDAEGKQVTKKSALIIPATGEHIPGRDNPTDLNGKYYHDLRCSKCTKTIDASPIECPNCKATENLIQDPSIKLKFTCGKLTCGEVFDASL